MADIEAPAIAGTWTVPEELTEQTEIVLLGGRVEPSSLLQGYASGLFPMEVPVAGDGDRPAGTVLAWLAPDPRGVLAPPGLIPSRSLRRSMSRFDFSVDEAFGVVVAGCADPRRPGGWISDDYQASYLALRDVGYAHSVEVWLAGELVGGLLGVELGGLFCADSKFRRVTDASKAAVAHLSRVIFGAPDGDQRLVDVQWLTNHLASLGCQEVTGSDYAGRLPGLLGLPPALGGPSLTR